MNDVTLLTNALEDNPDNAIVASMLLDELQAARGMTYSEAFRHIGHVMQTASDAREIRQAVQLLAVGSGSECWLRHYIRHDLDAQRWEGLNILVVSGGDSPLTLPLNPHHNTMGTPIVTATVGAAWVLARWKEEKERRDNRKRFKKAHRQAR